MSLSPETINKLLSMGVPNKVELDGHTYFDKTLHVLQPPEVPDMALSTLQGLVDLYVTNFDDIKDKVVAHVVNPTTVELLAKKADVHNRIRSYASAAYPEEIHHFPFGTWLPTENFIIAAQAGFQRVRIEKDDGALAKDLDYVLGIAGKIASGAIRNEDDDGITQTVSVRRGVQLKGEAGLRGVVNLAPYRTFAEIDQVISAFVFRAKEHTDQSILLALFEADGGRWRLDAVAAVAAWLKKRLPTAVQIIA
jgi:hypothetical protein